MVHFCLSIELKEEASSNTGRGEILPLAGGTTAYAIPEQKSTTSSLTLQGGDGTSILFRWSLCRRVQPLSSSSSTFTLI